jgi:hypothetical protein
MGRSDDVRGAGLRGKLKHGDGVFNRFGAIVDAKDYVAVNVNHRLSARTVIQISGVQISG